MSNTTWTTKEISTDEMVELFGHRDTYVDAIRNRCSVGIFLRDGKLIVEGEEAAVTKARNILESMLTVIRSQGQISLSEVEYLITKTHQQEDVALEQLLKEVIVTTAYGRPIRAKTMGQKKYVDAIRNNGFTFGIGPAGTGKTYLAMAMAIQAFKNKQVNRIILTRPAVEAGESLGFLPGDLQEKINPYLRPLYDALFEILGNDTYLKLKEHGQIEVAPLAYMRGRTLDNSFIVLDEAQNTTPEQMKMFLTRLGYGSKAVITGDITQVDLPRGKKSGLKVIQNILRGVQGVEFCEFDHADVVRHPLVQRVIEAFEKYESKKNMEKKEASKA